ncbi:hypothetical protein ACER0C_010452 [Sarotherodon galilaeus]
MEERISSLMFLCLVLSGVGAIEVTIPQSQYEYARGDNITLPCSFTSTVNLNTVPVAIISWTALAVEANGKDAMILTYYYPLKKTDITSSYKGRVSLDVDVLNGKANLKLSSISLADNKHFGCRVQIPGERRGKQFATTRLVVLEPPSAPVCKIQGKTEYGQNINLTCVSAEGFPPPTYSWKRYCVHNQPVPQDPSTTDKGGILSLYNISIWTSGYYVCTSQNKIHAATCKITLSVSPPKISPSLGWLLDFFN